MRDAAATSGGGATQATQRGLCGVSHPSSSPTPPNDACLFRRGFSTYRLENWYASVAHLTFATSVVRLEHAEAQMLQKFRDQQRAYFQAHGGSFVHDQAHYATMMDVLLKRLSPEHQRVLEALRERLRKPIDDCVRTSGGAFVKVRAPQAYRTSS